MLSRKNYNEKLRQMSNQKDRFSIRKLTVGAASVLIGITFMGFSGQKVNADEVTSTQPAVEQVTKTDTTQQDNSADNVQKASDTTQKVETTQSDAQTSTQAENKATTQQDKSVDANADNSKAEAENKTVETSNNDTKTSEAQKSEAKTDAQAQDKQTAETKNTVADTTQKKDEQTNQTQDLTVKSTDDKAQATASETTEKAQQSAAKALAQSKIEARINPESEGQFNVDDWDGSLDNTTHEYTLNGYHGTDTENIYIPNTQDFIDAGRISSNDKVYITKDLMQTITHNGAVNVTVDDQGEKNKVYAKGDWSNAFSAYRTNLKSVDLSHVDTSEVTKMDKLFLGSNDLESVNFSGCDLSNVTSLNGMFAWADGKLNDLNLTGTKGIPKDLLDRYIDIAKKTNKTNLDLSNATISSSITDLSGLFAGMPNVESIDLTGWDTSHVTNMSSMFQNDPKLTTIKGIENWDTSNVTNMSNMFASYVNHYFGNVDSTGSLTSLDLSNWDTHNVTDMSWMFTGQSHLTSLGDLSHRGNKWNTGKVTNMAYMFHGLENLPDSALNLNNWNTSNVTDMSYMFDGLKKQEHMDFLTNWNTSKVTDMSYMFSSDPALQSLDLSHWDVGKVGTKNTQQNYSFADMFNGDTSLTSVGDISHWNTKNVHDTRDMFYNTQKLNSLDLSGWDTSKLQIAEGMFECSGVKYINLDNWNFSPMKRLDYNGLVDDNGPLRGVANMFNYLQNKAVISMNNITLPDSQNAFSITDFEGAGYRLPNGRGGYDTFKAQPIIVIANGAAGNTLKGLNNEQWTDLNGNNVIGRQNTNKLTYVRADDNTKQIGQHSLDFVFTSVADLQNYLNGVTKEDVVKKDIGSLSHDWDANQDTNNDIVKIALRLSPASSYDPARDTAQTGLVDLMTSKYQLHIVDPTVTRETSDPTRTIIVDYPDGSTHREVQSVEFTRTVTKHIDNTEQVTPWTPASGNWNQYDVPQISGYDSYIDGVAGTVVNAKTVAPKGENATVHVTYVSNTPSNPGSNPDNPGNNPTNPSNPGNTPDNPGNNPEQPTAPVTPSEPNAAPKPETQPTTPANGNDNEKNNNQETVRPHAEKPATNNKHNGQAKNNAKKTIAPHAVAKPNKVAAPKSAELPSRVKNLAAKPASVVKANANAKANNKEKANTLPQTGEKKSNLGVIGLGLLVLAGLGIVDRKRRN